MHDMDMQFITKWDQLRPFGIEPLTGEADTLSLRLLCDLNEQGVRIITSFFGGNIRFNDGSNWNREGIASVMLPYGILAELAAFCLVFEKYERATILDSGTVIGYNFISTERIEELLQSEMHGKVRRHVRRFRCPSGTNGTRATHAFSGRSA